VTLLTQLAALLAIMGTAVVYGTDVFCAIAQRPALARVDDAALTTVMGNLHRYADRRMPVPGAIALLFSAVAAALAAVAGHWSAFLATTLALVLLLGWMALYVRISAPINRALTAAVDRHETPANARTLQHDWDRIIVLRASLQGLALLALGTSLIIS
jgi:hypothetical protein